MPNYTAPLTDLRFALDLAGFKEVASWPGFEDASEDLTDAVLDDREGVRRVVVDKYAGRHREHFGPAASYWLTCSAESTGVEGSDISRGA